jgi:very-short-patch-repair endonuclease
MTAVATTLQKAKALRQQQTDAEQKLWYWLRANRFGGVRFKRQKPVGPYVVDFVAVNEKLVIELDGGQHQERAARDQTRTHYLENRGYRVLRFWNDQCLTQTEAVLESIRQALFPAPPPQAEAVFSPRPLGGEGQGEGVRHTNVVGRTTAAALSPAPAPAKRARGVLPPDPK